MSRNPAAKGKADANQKAIADAIRMIGYPVMDLHSAGKGMEDLLVAVDKRNGAAVDRWWIVVEVKMPRNARGEVTTSQFTKAQKEWREMTSHWPRLTVTSAQDAVDRISELTRG
jgi:hypothetical protein